MDVSKYYGILISYSSLVLCGVMNKVEFYCEGGCKTAKFSVFK